MRNWMTVLQALELGIHVYHQGYEWILSDDNHLVVKYGQGYVNPIGDNSLAAFLQWCDSFHVEQIVKLQLDLALNKAKQKAGQFKG